MDPGNLIAIYVLLLYTFLAPLLLFGIFVLFDLLGSSSAINSNRKIVPPFWKKDPAVWTAEDIAAFQEQA